jgi:hypothetical protein
LPQRKTGTRHGPTTGAFCIGGFLPCPRSPSHHHHLSLSLFYAASFHHAHLHPPSPISHALFVSYHLLGTPLHLLAVLFPTVPQPSLRPPRVRAFLHALLRISFPRPSARCWGAAMLLAPRSPLSTSTPLSTHFLTRLRTPDSQPRNTRHTSSVDLAPTHYGETRRRGVIAPGCRGSRRSLADPAHGSRAFIPARCIPSCGAGRTEKARLAQDARPPHHMETKKRTPPALQFSGTLPSSARDLTDAVCVHACAFKAVGPRTQTPRESPSPNKMGCANSADAIAPTMPMSNATRTTYPPSSPMMAEQQQQPQAPPPAPITAPAAVGPPPSSTLRIDPRATLRSGSSASEFVAQSTPRLGSSSIYADDDVVASDLMFLLEEDACHRRDTDRSMSFTVSGRSGSLSATTSPRREDAVLRRTANPLKTPPAVAVATATASAAAATALVTAAPFSFVGVAAPVNAGR